MLKKYLIFFLLSLFSLNGCHKAPTTAKCSEKTIFCPRPSLTSSRTNPCITADEKNHTITIWIHGTSVFFSKFICPKFFYTRRGLHQATTFDPEYHVREIAELLYRADQNNYSVNTTYFYGWSGKLSFKARYKAARKLYVLLLELIEQYEKEHGIKPKIRIITHSHGGNVALSLARFNQDLKLQVEELILLACPVQERTCSLPAHETFKKVYSLFSRFDSFQILDPQWIYYLLKKDLAECNAMTPQTFFSQRLFPENDKTRQIQLKFDNRGIMHIEFITNKFVGIIPHIMHEIKNLTSDELNSITTFNIHLT